MIGKTRQTRPAKVEELFDLEVGQARGMLRRGLAAGLTAAGFGMGSAATIIPIAHMIKSSGYEHTFLTFGLFQGIVVVVVGSMIMAPALSFMVSPPKLAPGAGKPVARGRGRSARIADGLAIPLAITGTGEKAAADKDDF